MSTTVTHGSDPLDVTFAFPTAIGLFVEQFNKKDGDAILDTIIKSLQGYQIAREEKG